MSIANEEPFEDLANLELQVLEEIVGLMTRCRAAEFSRELLSGVYTSLCKLHQEYEGVLGTLVHWEIPDAAALRAVGVWWIADHLLRRELRGSMNRMLARELYGDLPARVPDFLASVRYYMQMIAEGEQLHRALVACNVATDSDQRRTGRVDDASHTARAECARSLRQALEKLGSRFEHVGLCFSFYWDETGTVDGRSSDRLERLVKRIGRAGDINDHDTPAPLVSLEHFFEGNDDPASIGCNLPSQVMPSEFYELLKVVRARSDVADVVVQVTMHEDSEAWPFSDTVWVITSATNAQVKSWLPERLAPDELFNGFHTDRPMETHAVPKDMRAVGLWYD